MKDFYFTFTPNQKDKNGNSLKDRFTTIKANNREQAREIMLTEYGRAWGYLYDNAFDAGVYKYSLEYIDFTELKHSKKKIESSNPLF